MAQTYAALEAFSEQLGPFNRRYYGTQPPTVGGPFTQGDVVVNTQPTSGAPSTWTCVASGSPGTWVGGGGHVLSVAGSITLAQLNAGATVVAPQTGNAIRVVDFWLQYNGTFTTATDIRISDTTPTLDIVTVLIADAVTLANTTPLGSATGAGVMETHTTVNPLGFGVALASGVGVQIRKTGSSAAGGTSIFYVIKYLVNA